jgi:uncharacterized protein
MIDLIKIPTRSWIHPALEVKISLIQGEGIFTTKDINAGEIVIIWGGSVVSIDDFNNGKGLKHTNVGLDENLFLVADEDYGIDIDDYMNHSCDPNTWLSDEITVVTRRKILIGEELTIDYVMELADEGYVMKIPCNCGSLKCRKRITGLDWNIKSLQEEYLDHFSPFIQRRINQNLKSEHRRFI